MMNPQNFYFFNNGYGIYSVKYIYSAVQKAFLFQMHVCDCPNWINLYMN